MRRLPLLAYFLVLWTSFTGALTAGLGQGFDLGTEWPSALYRLIEAAASGNFEPIHRFSTVAAGFAVFAVVLRHRRDAPLFALGIAGCHHLDQPRGAPGPRRRGAEALGLLRYPINNFFALLATFFVLALAVEEVTWRRRILLRGAAFWSVVASLSGAYILGVHEIDRVPFQYALASTPKLAPLLLHLAVVALAVALAVAAALHGSGWMRHVLLVAAAMQAVTGVMMYFGALENTWAPWAPGGSRPPDGHGLGSCISEVPTR